MAEVNATDIAQKWARIAKRAIRAQALMHDTDTDAEVQTLIAHVDAHYSTRNLLSLETASVYAIASVEAMNEWQRIRRTAGSRKP